LDDSFLAFFERLIQAGLGPYPRPRWLIQGGPIDHRFRSENNRRICFRTIKSRGHRAGRHLPCFRPVSVARRRTHHNLGRAAL